MADKLLGSGCGRDSIDEYGNQNQENMKGQSGSSMLTYKLLTLRQPVLALDDFGLSLPALGLISE